jgi:hypothetical protein
MAETKFRTIILPGHFLEDNSFSFVNFRQVYIEIPKEFLDAAWGYGHHYGLYYGRGL